MAGKTIHLIVDWATEPDQAVEYAKEKFGRDLHHEVSASLFDYCKTPENDDPKALRVDDPQAREWIDTAFQRERENARALLDEILYTAAYVLRGDVSYEDILDSPQGQDPAEVGMFRHTCWKFSPYNPQGGYLFDFTEVCNYNWGRVATTQHYDDLVDSLDELVEYQHDHDEPVETWVVPLYVHY